MSGTISTIARRHPRAVTGAWFAATAAIAGVAVTMLGMGIGAGSGRVLDTGIPVLWWGVLLPGLCAGTVGVWLGRSIATVGTGSLLRHGSRVGSRIVLLTLALYFVVPLGFLLYHVRPLPHEVVGLVPYLVIGYCVAACVLVPVGIGSSWLLLGAIGRNHHIPRPEEASTHVS